MAEIDGCIYKDNFGYRFPYYDHKNQGKRYPRVTTICKRYSDGGDGLLRWYASCVVEEVQEMVRQYQAKEIDLTGLLVGLQKDDLKNAAERKRDKAAGFGTVLHKTFEAYTNNDQKALEGIPDDVWPDVEALLDYFHKHNFKIRRSEQTIVNPELGYAGTFDAEADFSGRILLDIKRTKWQSDSWRIQTAFYTGPGTLMAFPDGSTQPVGEFDGRVILRVYDGRVEALELTDAKGDWQAARCALYFYHFGKKKTILPYEPRLTLATA